MTIYTLFLYLAIAGLALTLTLGYGHAQLFRKQEVKRPIIWFLQYFTGSLLLFSGFIKAVDPLGTAYKMKDYFDEFDNQGFPLMDFLAEHVVAFSVLMLVLELVLGFCMILGIGGKRTTLLTLLLMIFFTLLTGFNYLTGFTPNNVEPAVGIFEFSKWTAFNYDFIRIKDCGCFGDFMKLTPFTTFIKDIILTGVAIALHVKGNYLKDLIIITANPEKKQINAKYVRMGTVAALTLISWLFCLNGYYFNDATIDFRPFYAGVDIRAAQETCRQNPTVKDIKYVYKNEQTGEEKLLSMEDMTKPDYAYLYQAPWKYLDRRDLVVKEGCTSKIMEFGMDGDSSVTQLKLSEIKNAPTARLVVMAGDLEYSDKGALKAINDLAAAAEKESIPTDAFYYHAPGAGIEEFRHEHQLAFPFYTADDKLIKTVIRANPGLLLVKNGKIVAKWHHKHIPSYEELKKQF